jgi:hypothetical protein
MPTADSIRADAIAEAETALAAMGENVENLRTLIRLYGDAVWTADAPSRALAARRGPGSRARLAWATLPASGAQGAPRRRSARRRARDGA